MLSRLHQLTALPALALAAATLAAAPQTADASRDRDCADFETQRQAQRFFDRHDPDRDPHRLDEDGDTVACESLPCPCDRDTAGADDPPAVRRDRAKVLYVVDGDTLRVRLDGRKRYVRLIGIDTPEVHTGTECGGSQASRSATRLLKEGSKVTLVSDPSQSLRDRYGRLLRYAVQGGHDVGETQVRRGWAAVYVYDGRPFARVGDYRDAKRAAKHHDRGVWALCDGDFHSPE